jgi:hypothetical protein
MFFLLRCAFFLGLVFLAMARDAGALPFRSRLAAPRLASATAKDAARLCVHRAKVCVSLARRAAAQAQRSPEASDLGLPWRDASGG